VFAVAKIFAVRFSTCARQRNLCRAETHGKDAMHGNCSFSRSDTWAGKKTKYSPGLNFD
jgi:hypothetical protein